MAKHNYSKYSNNNKNDAVPEVKVSYQNDETVAEEVENTVVDTTVETPKVTADIESTVETDNNTETKNETNSGAVVKGVVANCAKLNVRSKPSINSGVVTVLDTKTEITIDVDTSTDEWFKIRTVAGVEGYCMRKFVNANI